MDSSQVRNRWYLNENIDLLWDIDCFSKKEMAFDFVLNFESRLCVYSPNLSQLYGQYSINATGRHGETLVVLPEIYTTERFIGVGTNAVKPTGIYIHPGWLFDLGFPHVMTIPVRHQGRTLRSKPIPMAQGFALVNNRLRKANFLPVIINGALREYRRTAPYLHLHRLDLTCVDRSDFDKRQIKRTIYEKLSDVMPKDLMESVLSREEASFSQEFMRL